MEEARVPGVSIAVAADGSVWYRVFGVANAQTKVAVTHDTIFEAASISKPTFAYAVLKMADEAMLDLDRPLLNYVAPDDIDSIVQRRVRDGRLSLVTARMVLSHTSGFPHAAEAGAERVLEFGPGSKFKYSDEGYNFLQRVVEHITGSRLNTIVARYVFQPLEMRDSSYVWRDDYESRMAFGHLADGTPQPIWREAIGFAASTLYTTAADYAKFLRALLARKGLSQQAFDEMFQPQPMTGPSSALRETWRWGLGVGLLRSDNGDMFWQWGDNDVFRGYMAGLVNGTTAIVFFTNSQNGLKITDPIVEQVIGAQSVLKEFGYP